MSWLRLFFDPTGRIGRRAFLLSVTGLYATWFLAPMGIAATDVAGGMQGQGGPKAADTLLPLLTLMQFAVWPYINVCLHLKRLRDAGRGPGSLIAIIAFSLVAIPAALAFGTWLLRDQSSVENLNYPIMWVVAIVLAVLAMGVTWLCYDVWVGTGEPAPAPRRDVREPAAQGD